MSKAKEAVQCVRVTHQAFLDNVKVMHSTRGAEYESAKAQDQPLWDAYQKAQDDLRGVIRSTFGVNIYDLRMLLGS